MTAQQDAVKLIAKVDEGLSIIREAWLECTPGQKPKWQNRIDAALDERLALMKIRDQITQ
jgi:hypothetical protein